MRVEVVWPLEALVWFWLVHTMRSHIHTWKWHGGDWMKERFGSSKSMARWYMEVTDLVGFCIC